MTDEELKGYLDGKFTELRTEVRTEFAAIRTRMDETDARIEATETRLLTEFWKWGRNSDRRMRLVEQNSAAATERLAEMEERIFTLERKVAGGKE